MAETQETEDCFLKIFNIYVFRQMTNGVDKYKTIHSGLNTLLKLEPLTLRSIVQYLNH